MKLMQRDKGYAWIILTCSSIVMFAGSSTYTGFGVLFSSIKVENSLTNWILNVLYSSWFGIALIAGPLAMMYTHRKIVMFGFFLASIGTAVSGVILNNAGCLILTYSIVVGIGVGIGVHESYLLVLCHFNNLRGLAVGILSTVSLLGQAVTPLIYESLPDVKDKFYIRALMTAICFMASSFFIAPSFETVPTIELKPIPNQGIKIKQRTPSANKTFKENKFINHKYNANAGNIPDRSKKEYKMIEVNSEQEFCLHLPNIPEEAEDLSNSACSVNKVQDNLTIQTFQTMEEKSKEGVLESYGISSMSEGHVAMLKQQSLIPSIKPLEPELISKINQRIHRRPHTEKISKKVNNTATFRYRLDSIFDPDVEFMQQEPVNPDDNSNFLNYWKEALGQFDYSLLKNLQFLNVIIGCNLGIISLSIFPIVLSSYILQDNFTLNSTSTSVLNGSNYLSDHFSNSNVNETEKLNHINDLLSIIFTCDALTRVVVGYLCDFAYFNKRAIFLAGLLLGGLCTSSIRLINNMTTIKIFSGIYGCTIGSMASTEVLLLLDEFGMEKLPSSYGLLFATRVLLNFLIAPLIYNSASQYLYTIHPFSSVSNRSEIVCEFHSCDPFELFNTDTGIHSEHIPTVFIWFGLPIICGILWCIEILWVKLGSKLIARFKIIDLPIQINGLEDLPIPNTAFQYKGRPRSYSSPLI